LVIVGPTDDPPGEDPMDDAPSVRAVDCSWNVGCGWNVPPEEQPLTQAARARGSVILRQPHASCACASMIDISKNKCAVAITTVERDTACTPIRCLQNHPYRAARVGGAGRAPRVRRDNPFTAWHQLGISPVRCWACRWRRKLRTNATASHIADRLSWRLPRQHPRTD
jgi:hypothetical protein